MPELAVIAELDKHRKAVPIDHLDQSVTRAKLEYPTVDVYLVYLTAIGKTQSYGIDNAQHRSFVATVDAFTDKAVEAWVNDSGKSDDYHKIAVIGRISDGNNTYYLGVAGAKTTADFGMGKIVGGSFTTLGYESVDLATDAVHSIMLSISGSTLKGYRAGTLKISVTDTSLASGGYGVKFATSSNYYTYDCGFVYATAVLRAPTSALQPATAIIEAESIGSGTPEDPLRPMLSQNLVDVPDSAPDFLKLEKKRYDVLRSKGFTDEEIALLFGSFQTKIDLDAVTWGAFEFSEKSPTNIIVVAGDNPYKPGAVDKQKAAAKRSFASPKTYDDAVSLYNQLKRDFPHWLAGKDSFAYQVLGYEKLEPLAVADFYYGELIEHKAHYDQLKRVPDWEMRNVLKMWSDRLERAKPNLPPDEYQKHKEKLGKVLRLGW